MRGGHMNSKYPPRGGSSSSFRGSAGQGSYGYYDSYYNSSPIRGGRGGYRGRGGGYGYSNTNANVNVSGHYGNSNGYSAPYGSYGSIGNSGSHNNSGLTPTSSSAASVDQHASDSSLGNISHENIENGYNDSRMIPSSTGSNSSEGWESGYGDYNNSTSFGRGGISPRYRGFRGRGRGNSRGGWRGGNRGGSNVVPSYYGRGRNGYEYDSYNSIPPGSSGQYYYERDYGVEAGIGRGFEGTDTNITNKSNNNNAYGYSSHRASNTSVDESYANTSISREEDEAAKVEKEKAKAKELKQKQDQENKINAEFKEKHWIERIHVSGDAKKSISKCFDELDSANDRLLDIGARRIELEIAINRYNRALKAEEERVRIGEEKLESMNLDI